MNKELKSCMNDTCPRYNVDYECHCDYAEYCSNLRLCNIQLAIDRHMKLCKKYAPTKPESAWEMFRELIVQVDNVQFADELFEELGLNTWEFVDEQKAIKIMQKKNRILKNE